MLITVYRKVWIRFSPAALYSWDFPSPLERDNTSGVLQQWAVCEVRFWHPCSAKWSMAGRDTGSGWGSRLCAKCGSGYHCDSRESWSAALLRVTHSYNKTFFLNAWINVLCTYYWYLGLQRILCLAVVYIPDHSSCCGGVAHSACQIARLRPPEQLAPPRTDRWTG